MLRLMRENGLSIIENIWICGNLDAPKFFAQMLGLNDYRDSLTTDYREWNKKDCRDERVILQSLCPMVNL